MIVLHEGRVLDLDPVTEFSYRIEYGSPVEYTIRGYSDEFDYGGKTAKPKKKRRGMLIEPKKVIYNAPATIVYWTDGTKTIVKCQPGDEYDPLKGFLMAVFKKVCGNKSNYNNTLRKIVPGYGKE